MSPPESEQGVEAYSAEEWAEVCEIGFRVEGGIVKMARLLATIDSLTERANDMENAAAGMSADLSAEGRAHEKTLERLEEADRKLDGYAKALLSMTTKKQDAEARLQSVEEALRESPEKWSFWTLVTIGRRLLEVEYPPEVFPREVEKPSGDAGPEYIRALSGYLRSLTPTQPSGSVEEPPDA